MRILLNDQVNPPSGYNKNNPLYYISPKTIRRFSIVHQDTLFLITSLSLIFMELIIAPLELAFGVERLGFYLVLTLYFLYLLRFFLAEREGRTTMYIGGKNISFTSEQNKFLVSKFGPIVLIVLTIIFYFPKIFVSIDFIDFHQYLYIYSIYGVILIKFFNIQDDDIRRYPNQTIKGLMYLNYALLFVIPLLLTLDPFTNTQERILAGGLIEIESSINFIQNQILLAIGILIFVGCAGKDLVNYWKGGTENLIKTGFVAVLYLVFEFNILTQTSGTNMFKAAEIIIFQASTLILISSGLTLTTRVRKFGNFAHAEFVAIGLYAAINIRTAVFLQNILLYEHTGIFGVLVFAFIFTGICGILGEVLVFAPLDRRNADPLTLMVASIGMGLVIRQSIQEFYGGGDQGSISPEYPLWLRDIRENVINKFPIVEIGLLVGLGIGFALVARQQAVGGKALYLVGLSTFSGWAIGHFLGMLIPEFKPNDAIDPGDKISDWSPKVTTLEMGYFKFFGLKIRIFDPVNVIVPVDHAWAFLVMIIAVLSLRIIFTKTVLGISMRATADDESLSLITGINTRLVIYWTWFIAAGITGVGALYHFESSNVIPASGFRVLLIIFAVVILGGFDSFEGTLISAFIVSTVKFIAISSNDKFKVWEEESDEIDTLVFWNARSDWSNVIPFAIIIIVLLIRPRGIFGVVDPRSKL